MDPAILAKIEEGQSILVELREARGKRRDIPPRDPQFVLAPGTMDLLRADPRTVYDPGERWQWRSFMGIPIVEKPYQRRAAWLIGDPELLANYLAGKIPETTLERLSETEDATPWPI